MNEKVLYKKMMRIVIFMEGYMRTQVVALFKAVLLVGWFLLASTIVGIGVQLFIGEEEHYYNVLMQHQFALSLGSQLLCFIGIVLTTPNQPVIKKGSESVSFKSILRYMVMGLGAWLICILITQILTPFFPDYEAINQLFVNNEDLLRFCVVVIMAPLLEEYLFRGKILAYLKTGFPVKFAILIQALLFASLHALALQKIYSFIMGIIFGIVREKEKNFWSTFIMHMLINLIGWYIGSYAVSMG